MPHRDTTECNFILCQRSKQLAICAHLVLYITTDEDFEDGKKDSPITSPGNSWNLLGKANVCFIDHSPNCLASTSNA